MRSRLSQAGLRSLGPILFLFLVSFILPALLAANSSPIGVISIPTLRTYRGGEISIRIQSPGASPGPCGLQVLVHLPGTGVAIVGNLGGNLSAGSNWFQWDLSRWVAAGTPFTLRLSDANGRVWRRTFIYGQ